MASQNSVLVIGAGPVGLTLALDLTRRGIPVRIVDKKSGLSTRSKALGVSSGTCEAFEAAFGSRFIEELQSHGFPMQRVEMNLDDREPIQIDLSSIPSKYNSISIVPQSKTEETLMRHLNELGVKVEWETEATVLRQTAEQVVAEVRGIEANYAFIAGCDGAHSKVRDQLGLDFAGGQYEGQFALGDVRLTWDRDPEQAYIFLNSSGVIACFPMPGEMRYRLVVVPKQGSSPVSEDLDSEQLAEALKPIAPEGFSFEDPTWLSSFGVHHRMTEEMQVGRVFLAGDAAHIHSPVGGQGMNLGIQDALSLSYRLWCVMRRGAGFDSLLEYERERLPVIRAVVRTTDAVFRVMIQDETWWFRLMRATVMPLFAKSPAVQARMARRLSQIDAARSGMALRRSD